MCRSSSTKSDRLGMTGRVWAHELFDLPCHPISSLGQEGAERRAVRQRGTGHVLPGRKVQHHLGGDSVGMVRLLALLGKLDLERASER